jgi:hypothetical protein
VSSLCAVATPRVLEAPGATASSLAIVERGYVTVRVIYDASQADYYTFLGEHVVHFMTLPGNRKKPISIGA